MIKKIATAILIFVPIVIMGAKSEDGSKVNRAKTIEIDIEDKTTEEDTTDKQLDALGLMQIAETMVEDEIKNEEDDSNYKKKEKIHMANRGVSKPVPKKGTSMKSYMDYKAITNTASKQYKLLERKDVYIDEEGFLRISDKFLIAVGTYFGADIGQEVEVELSSGIKFNALIGDIKADKDTDEMNLSHPDGSVIEFLVNVKNKEGENYPVISNLPREMGNMSYAEKANFKGDVVGITVYE